MRSGPPVAELAAAGVLVAHCGCMRGCEHREGLRTRDIVHMDSRVVLLRVAARYGRKKIKYRPARVVAPLPSQDFSNLPWEVTKQGSL